VKDTAAEGSLVEFEFGGFGEGEREFGIKDAGKGKGDRGGGRGWLLGI